MIFHRLMTSCGEVKSFVTGNKSGVLAAILSMGGTAGEGPSVATGNCMRKLDSWGCEFLSYQSALKQPQF